MGGPDQTDLQGEYFTPETNIVILDEAMPVFVDGLDPESSRTVLVGIARVVKRDAVGLWVETQLDEDALVRKGVQGLIEQGQLHYASMSFVVDSVDGQITRWVPTGITLTPCPAEPRNTEVIKGENWATGEAQSEG